MDRATLPTRRGHRRWRAPALVVALLALLGGYLTVTSTSASAAETLLSQGRPATASSTESVATPARAAVDGNLGTRWSSAFSRPAVDPGRPRRVRADQPRRAELGGRVRHRVPDPDLDQRHHLDHRATPRPPAPAACRPSRSPAPAATCGSTAPPGPPRTATRCGSSRCTATPAARPAAAPPTPPRAGRPPPRPPRTPATPASAAVDGNTGTRWSSAAGDPQWLQVDLGASQSICGVTLSWEAAYATAFQIQISAERQHLDHRLHHHHRHRRHADADGQRHRPLRAGVRHRAGHRSGASRCGSSRYASAAAAPAADTADDPADDPAHDPAVGRQRAAVVQQAGGRPPPPSTTRPAGSAPPARAFDNDPAIALGDRQPGRLGRPGLDLRRPRRHGHDPAGRPPVGSGVRHRVPDPGLDQRQHLDDHLLDHHRPRLQGDHQRQRHRPLRADVRHRPGQRRTATRCGSSRCTAPAARPTTPPAQPADPVFPATRLVFSDEFNGAAGSKPDPAKWTIDPGTGQNNEVQYYTNNNNANMDGAGSLVIEARREAAGGREYTSHRMNTSNKFHVQYGRIEARVRVPKGNGLWPAFWMMGADFLTGRPWPYNGEIDIMEVLGRNTLEGYSTLHAPAYNGGGGYGQTYTAPGGVDLSAGFHVWSAEWDSRGITLQARRPDGVLRRARRRSRRPADRGSSTTRSTSSSTSPSAVTSPARRTPPRRSRPGCSSTTCGSTSDPGLRVTRACG